jgi:hypothetical protein
MGRLGLAIAVACILCLAGFLWEGPIGFNLADEGFLWYGAQRVMHGEAPLRDFMAYDPGRYYWAAMIMGLGGDNGLVSLWVSVAIFQTIGLFLALASVQRLDRRLDPAWLIIVAATLLIWMIPRHKIFDISTSIFLVATLAWLMERPDKTRLFLAGIAVGLAAVINRNHGIYGLLGYFGVIALLCSGPRQTLRPLPQVSLWLAGVAVGFLPVGLLMILYPGFAAAFWESIRFVVELMVGSRNTNLPLPVPWPWRAVFETGDWLGGLRAFFLGCLFVGIVLYGALGVAVAIYRRRKRLQQPPWLVASAFMALPYAHHAFSRAEILHLAQGLFPVLIGVFAWASSRGAGTRWGIGMGLVLVSLVVALPAHLGYQRANEGNWTEVRIGTDTIKVSPATANNILALQNLIDRYAPPREDFLVVPYWPGAYAMVERKSPMWEIYALFSRSRRFEENELVRISNTRPRFAVVQDIPLDGREDLRFSNTHPLIHQYILANFIKVTSPFADATLNVYLPPQGKP